MAIQGTKRRHRTQDIAAMFAIAVIPRTFQRSLLPRSTTDQGIVTSVTVVLVYMLGLLTQDTIEAATKVSIDQESTTNSSRKSLMLVSAAALGAGLLTQKLNKYSSDEKLPKAATRTFGQWVKYAGIAGLIIEAVETVNETVSKDKKAAEKRDLLPYFVGAGLLYSMIGEYKRVRGESGFSLKTAIKESKPTRVIGITAGVTALIGGLVYTERLVARKIDSTFSKSGKSLMPNWLPLGHIVGVGAIVGAIYTFMHKTYGSIEHKATEVEKGFTQKPKSIYLSGGSKSLVEWDTLSVQGRRHIGTALTAANIKKVMNEPALQPIRIFVGLDSANTEEERVKLALAELERTNAYDRKHILVVSPTGTGYVNYVMSESVEYQTRGDVASVTIQYSKRPSPMSLDRVGEGHIQYRMLLNGINRRIRSMPARKRPRVILFGESLGAWTSQDALMNSGTDGLKALSIDRALWIGTPMGSKWKDQVLSNNKLDTDSELIGCFDSYEEVEDLDTEARNSLRYVMVTHHNDPIAQFGLKLLIQQPEWITDETKRPKGFDDSTQYRSPTLFIQTLVDMKNALKPIPGEFVASAHDYRGDLARFVSFTYGFKISATQLERIEQSLRDNEVIREHRIKGDV